MRRLVLTAIGDDRAGLVAGLSEVIAEHGGNWERSQMTELAGKFAGIVVVSVPADRYEALMNALAGLEGLLEVAAHAGADVPRGAVETVAIDLLGNDRPGIVREVSGVLRRHNVSIETIDTLTREAPMAGGQLFEAHIVGRLPQAVDRAALRADLEILTGELLVDLNVS